MNRMEIDTRTDERGSLRIQVPGRPSRHHVHVIIEWDESTAEAPSDWPPGWFERVPGSITDPIFVRHPQPAYETREELK